MPIQNTTATYGSVAKTLHWLTALLILTAIPLGLIANQLPYDTGEELARKAWLFSLHKTTGIAAFAVALARILWALIQPKPAPLHPDRRAETFLAETVHWLLYAALVVVPLSGWIHHAATTGFAPILWPLGQSLPLVPKSEAVAGLFASVHWVFTKLLALALVLHIAGAIKHALIDRDQTLARMLPGQPDVKAPPTKARSTPLAAAVILYIFGAAGAATLAAQAPHEAPTTAAPALAAAPSQWQVAEGTLQITVQQLGSAVTGSFADWTAAIDFDETATGGKHGTAEVQIAIASLTLGSVTSQALGPDFFAANQHPTATFAADLLPADTGYLAEGSLTLRGAEVRVSMPFVLEIDGDTARMTATTQLDRRDFGIGETYPDESSVGFGVGVDITLTASRTN
ncbi:MAG: cytochrome b/b6 domain-containing protein [Rhodobacter sp.]|nr:cytochrome b/b6 domain-containing protein [Rhodobacter sp.]